MYLGIEYRNINGIYSLIIYYETLELKYQGRKSINYKIKEGKVY